MGVGRKRRAEGERKWNLQREGPKVVKTSDGSGGNEKELNKRRT